MNGYIAFVKKEFMENKTVVVLLILRRISNISFLPAGSSALVGSSQIRSRGFVSKACAIPRRCFMPREKPPICFVTQSKPTRVSSYCPHCVISVFDNTISAPQEGKKY